MVWDHMIVRVGVVNMRGTVDHLSGSQNHFLDSDDEYCSGC